MGLTSNCSVHRTRLTAGRCHRSRQTDCREVPVRDDFSHKIRRILADRAGHGARSATRRRAGLAQIPGALFPMASRLTSRPRLAEVLVLILRSLAKSAGVQRMGYGLARNTAVRSMQIVQDIRSQHCKALRDAVKKQPQRRLARRLPPRTNQPVSLSFLTQIIPTNSLKSFRLNPTHMPRRWSFASNYGKPDDPRICST